MTMLLPLSVFTSPDSLTTPSARWDMLRTKLNTAQEAGMTFRHDITSFEQAYGYGDHTPDHQNNCYASAVGFLVTGDRTICPGVIKPLLQNNRNGILYGDAKDNIIPPYKATDAEQFYQTFSQGLQDDGVLSNVPVTDRDKYVPIIGLTYYCKYKSDFHFIVPTANGEFSDRKHRRGAIEHFTNAHDMMNTYLGRDCLQVDVYFALKSYHGQKAVMTDAARVKANQVYHGASAGMFGG